MLGLTRLGIQAFLAAMGIQLVSSLMGTAVASIAPEIAKSLNANSTFAGLYIGFLYVGACISSLTGGNFIRRYGPAHICMIALAVAIISLLLCMVPWEVCVIFSAFVLGLAKGPLMPAINTMLSRQLEKGQYNTVFSIKQCAGPVGMALSGLVIPFLTVRYGWRVGLSFVAVLCAVTVIWSMAIRKSQDASYQFKDEPITLSHLADSMKLVLKTPLLLRLSVLSIIYKGLQMSVLAYMVVFLSDMKFSLVFGGIALAVSNFGAIVGRLFWGQAANKLHSSRKALAYCGILMGAFTILLSFVTSGWAQWLVLAISFILGINSLGWSGVFFAQVAKAAPEGKVAEATGGVDFFSFVGAIFVPMAFGFLGHHLGEFQTGFWIVSGVTIAAALYLLFVPDIDPNTQAKKA